MPSGARVSGFAPPSRALRHAQHPPPASATARQPVAGAGGAVRLATWPTMFPTGWASCDCPHPVRLACRPESCPQAGASETNSAGQVPVDVWKPMIHSLWTTIAGRSAVITLSTAQDQIPTGKGELYTGNPQVYPLFGNITRRLTETSESGHSEAPRSLLRTLRNLGTNLWVTRGHLGMGCGQPGSVHREGWFIHRSAHRACVQKTGSDQGIRSYPPFPQALLLRLRI